MVVMTTTSLLFILGKIIGSLDGKFTANKERMENEKNESFQKSSKWIQINEWKLGKILVKKINFYEKFITEYFWFKKNFLGAFPQFLGFNR